MRRLILTSRWLALSLLVTAVIAMPLSLVLVPKARRAYRLAGLSSTNPRRQELALNYVARAAARDPAVLANALGRLDSADDRTFLRIAVALIRAGRWRREDVPIEAMLRRTVLLANEADPEARIIACHSLADMQDLAKDGQIAERMAAALKMLSRDPTPDVRYNAMVAAAEMAGATLPNERFRPLIAACVNDESPEIARQAWLFLGVLHWTDGVEPRWREVPSTVAEAMLWAIANTEHARLKLSSNIGASQTKPASRASDANAAIHDAAAIISDATSKNNDDPVIRAAAAYSLSLLPEATVRERIAHIDSGWHSRIDVVSDAAVPHLIWRMSLGAPPLSDEQGLPQGFSFGLPMLEIMTSDRKDPSTTPENLASIWKYSPQYIRRLTRWRALLTSSGTTQPAATLPAHDSISQQSAAMPNWWSDDQPEKMLAILEGLAGRNIDFTIPARVPHLLRLAAVAAMKSPTPEDLREVFTAESAELRDLACVLAADRFTPEQNAALVRWALLNYNDDAKRAGAILSGLTGQQADLLAQRMEIEDVWSVQAVMKLGLWMQGKLAGIDKMIPGLLIRPDVARSTILLALLHKRDTAGLDYLLNPRGEPRFDVLSQLDQKRWWGVLRRYLPPDAPPFWVYADRDLQSFQLDVLRNWYTVNRRRLYPHAR